MPRVRPNASTNAVEARAAPKRSSRIADSKKEASKAEEVEKNKKNKLTANLASSTSAKRGRKPKASTSASANQDSAAEPKRGRGRPPKSESEAVPAVAKKGAAGDAELPRKRGRPKGTGAAPIVVKAKKRGRPVASAADAEPRKRGRPAASAADAEPRKRGRPASSTTKSQPKKRGRPAASVADVLPKKRGRPAGSKVTKSNRTETETTKNQERAASGRRGRPPKNVENTSDPPKAIVGKKRDRPPVAALDEEDAPKAKKAKRQVPKNSRETKQETLDGAVERETASVGILDSRPKYWLMKAEPESRIEKGRDVKFSIDDLKNASKPEPWDGVRNHVAKNNLKSMQKGEHAFFYHSNCKVPGVAGILEIVEEASVDESAFDPDHPYYDEKSTRDKPRWFCPKVTFHEKFPEVVRLDKLRSHGEAGGPLSSMLLLKQSRLSVSEVSQSEWDFVLGLAKGNEDELGGFSAHDMPEIEVTSQGAPTEASGALSSSLAAAVKVPTLEVAPSVEAQTVADSALLTPTAQLESESNAAIIASESPADPKKTSTVKKARSAQPTPATKSKSTRRSASRTPGPSPRVSKRRSTSRQLSPSLAAAVAGGSSSALIGTIVEAAEIPALAESAKPASSIPALSELVPLGLQKIIGNVATPEVPES